MFGDADLLIMSFVVAVASFSTVIFGDGLPNIPPCVSWTFTIKSAKFEIQRVALLGSPHSLLADLRTKSATLQLDLGHYDAARRSLQSPAR